MKEDVSWRIEDMHWAGSWREELADEENEELAAKLRGAERGRNLNTEFFAVRRVGIL